MESELNSRLMMMWAVPRSRSTAFYRMIKNRGDFFCVHEPIADVTDMGIAKINLPSGGTRNVRTEEGVLDTLLELAANTNVFCKETVEFDYQLRNNRDFLLRTDHVLMIRSPRQTILSHLCRRPHLSCIQVGYENLLRLFQSISQTKGRAPLVIDSDSLIDDPSGTVEAFCHAAGLKYRTEALHWSAGEQPEWMRCADWHKSVSGSAGFERRIDSGRYSSVAIDESKLNRFIDHHTPFYEQLREHAVKPLIRTGSKATC